MEDEEGKMDGAADGRKKTDLRSGKKLGKSAGGRGMQWSIIVAGAFLLSLAAFITGVRMGKGLSDLKHSGVPSVKAQPKEQKSSPFHIDKKSPDPPAGKGDRISAPQPPPSPPEPEKIIEEKISRPPEKETPPPPAATKVTPSPKAQFTLQVAALSNAEEARDLVSRLRSKGYEAYQVTGTAAAKGTLYRVRVGQFRSLGEARQFALTFEKKEKIKTIIASLQ